MRLPVFPAILFLLLVQMTLLVAPLIMPLTPTRANMEQLLSQRLQQSVKIGGDVHLRLLPRPQIIFNDTTLAATDRSHMVTSAEVERVIVDLSWGGLSEWQLKIGQLTLEGMKTQIAMSADMGDLLGQWQETNLPPISLARAEISVSGLNKAEPGQVITFNHLHGDIETVGFGAALRVSMRQVPPAGAASRYTLLLERDGARVAVDFEADSDGGDEMRFVGYVRQTARWRADGELSFRSTSKLAQSLASIYGFTLAPTGQGVALTGLISADAQQLKSDNLQLQALDTVFQSRLSLLWPSAQQANPHITARATAGFVDLSQIRRLPDAAPNRQAGQHQSGLVALWQDLFDTTNGALRVEADRFGFAEEVGRNLIVAIAPENRGVKLQRISADLPFRSTILGAGEFTPTDQGTAFEGSFSTRSSDTLGMAIWLGNITGQDLSSFVETVDEARLQRASFVSDVVWSPDVFELRSLSGRLGDDYIELNLSLPQTKSQNSVIDLFMARLDLADWGITALPSLTNGRTPILPEVPINRLLGLLLTTERQRNFTVDLDLDQLYVGTQSLGPVRFSGGLTGDQLDINNLTLSAYNGARLSFDGRVQFDGTETYGAMSMALQADNPSALMAPIVQRFAPIPINLDAPLAVQSDWLLSARDSPDWPTVGMKGTGTMGGLAVRFDLATPDRKFNFDVSGSERKLELTGAASDLAARLSLTGGYEKAAPGRLNLVFDTLSGSVSKVDARLEMGQDSFVFTGATRPDTAGKRLDGQLQIQGTEGFVVALMPDVFLNTDQGAVNFKGKSQIVMTPEALSFSGLNVEIAGGRVSGEGRLSTAQEATALSANLVLEKFGMNWLLPDYTLVDGWSNQEMQWRLLGQSDVDLDLRLSEVTLGRLPVDAATARIKVRDGVLEAPDIEATLLGGQISANIQAEGGALTPAFSMSARASDIEMSKIMQAVYGETLVHTRLTGAMTMRGRGRSAYGMIASLTGNANLEGTQGALTFVNLDTLTTDRQTDETLADVTLADDTLADDIQANEIQADETPAEAPTETQAEANELADGQAQEAPATDDPVQRYAGRTAFERGLAVLNMRDGVVRVDAADIVFAPPRRDAKLALELDLLLREIEGQFSAFSEDGAPALKVEMKGDIMAPKVAYRLQGAAVAPLSDPVPDTPLEFDPISATDP